MVTASCFRFIKTFHGRFKSISQVYRNINHSCKLFSLCITLLTFNEFSIKYLKTPTLHISLALLPSKTVLITGVIHTERTQQGSCAIRKQNFTSLQLCHYTLWYGAERLWHISGMPRKLICASPPPWHRLNPISHFIVSPSRVCQILSLTHTITNSRTHGSPSKDST